MAFRLVCEENITFDLCFMVPILKVLFLLEEGTVYRRPISVYRQMPKDIDRFLPDIAVPKDIDRFLPDIAAFKEIYMI
jgi:hypothetical protein